MQISTENKLVPKLRFMQFTDELSKNKLSEFSDKISDGIHSTPKYNEEGNYFFVNGNNLIRGKIAISKSTKKVDEIEFEKHKRPLNNRTILLSINGTIGNIAFYNNEPIILGKSACYINLNESIKKDFIFQYIQSDIISRYFYSQLTGSTIMNLSLRAIKDTPLKLPSLPEQQKIASFLSAVDEKLQQLTKKKELLEKYKKGVMQKIFSQELRFKDDNGNNYPDWEEKKLGEVCKIFGRIGFRGYTVQDIVKKGEGAITISPSDITDNKINFDNCTYISWDKYEESPEIKVFNNDILLVKTASIGKSAIVKNLSHKATINPQFVVLKEVALDNDFLYYYMNYDSFKRQIKRIAAGGVLRTISQEHLKELNIPTPSINEQAKMVSFLLALDKKIKLVANQLDNTKAFKKGLLQQMFV